ncbi:MAG TPA: DUF5710 domain-containing protein [Telluria sp.]|jgi:hypothetical protein
MIFLNVPYVEKDEARALGARWNPGRKRWYVPDGVAVDPFAKWMAQPGEVADADTNAKGGRRDSASAKLVTGANYVELAHACNPFEPCAECASALAGTPWVDERAALVGALGKLKR